MFVCICGFVFILFFIFLNFFLFVCLLLFGGFFLFVFCLFFVVVVCFVCCCLFVGFLLVFWGVGGWHVFVTIKKKMFALSNKTFIALQNMFSIIIVHH